MKIIQSSACSWCHHNCLWCHRDSVYTNLPSLLHRRKRGCRCGRFPALQLHPQCCSCCCSLTCCMWRALIGCCVHALWPGWNVGVAQSSKWRRGWRIRRTNQVAIWSTIVLRSIWLSWLNFMVALIHSSVRVYFLYCIVPLIALSPAPPLTLDNILNVVKNVRSWRTLGQLLCSYLSSELDDIQRQHVSDEACLKAVIEGFLSGKGDHYKQPSWRAIIWSLYRANEIQLAEHIRSFAEPVQGNESYKWHITQWPMLHVAGYSSSSVFSPVYQYHSYFVSIQKSHRLRVQFFLNLHSYCILHSY